jgi:hypothetical protein
MQRTFRRVWGEVMLETNEVETSEKIITPKDYCDRCIAKAAYMVVFLSGDLYFCGHHFRENEKHFVNTALNIYDENDEILMESGASDIQ